MLVELSEKEVEAIAIALVRFTRETAMVGEQGAITAELLMKFDGLHEYDISVMRHRGQSRQGWELNAVTEELRHREPFADMAAAVDRWELIRDSYED